MKQSRAPYRGEALPWSSGAHNKRPVSGMDGVLTLGCRRWLIRYQYWTVTPKTVVVALLGLGLVWLTLHSLTNTINITEQPQAAGDEREVRRVDPAVLRVVAALMHQKKKKDMVDNMAAAKWNPVLDDLHQLKWPPQDADPSDDFPETAEGVPSPARASTNATSGFWSLKRAPPLAAVGTDSVVSVNTSAQVPGKVYLNLLHALMFRQRPSDDAYNINASLSDRTPLDRPLPDSRQMECRHRKYDDVSSLPDITAIIPFYNEPLSMLLRTVHSIVNRTPPPLLREIILVDDASDNHDLGVPLEKYLQLLPKVILIRNRVRLGLIRTRQLGADLARGEVLVFQDAHTECNVGWLPPLLEEIVKDRRTLVQPVVDNIHPDSLVYEQANMGAMPRSSFTWDLRLVWTRIPSHENHRRRHPTAPFRAPTLVGCAMAVDRAFFKSIGGFDPDMNIWGGENFETPFRIWLCGGQVLTVPCSRVGHTFRRLPYLVGEAPAQIERNLLRTAELWMGDYKRFVYGAIPDRYNLTHSDFESIHRRRKELSGLGLKCRSFDWYLQTLVPEVPLPPEGVELFGEVGNFHWTSCVALFKGGEVDLTNKCFMARLLPENFFTLDEKSGRLIHISTRMCIQMEVRTQLLLSVPCEEAPSGQIWSFRRSVRRRAGQLVLRPGGGGRELCLTQTGQVSTGQRLVRMRRCRDGWDAQIWVWTYDFDPRRMGDEQGPR